MHLYSPIWKSKLLKADIVLESANRNQCEGKIKADLATILINYGTAGSSCYVTLNTLFVLTKNLNIPCLITPDVYNVLFELFENEKLCNNLLRMECQFWK